MTKKGSKCFLQLLEANISLVFVIPPWPPHPSPCLLSEDGRSLHCPQAAARLGNLESLCLCQFKGWAHNLDALMRCRPMVSRKGARNPFTFPGFSVKARGQLSLEPLLSPSHELLPLGERKTNNPEGFFCSDAMTWPSVTKTAARCQLGEGQGKEASTS